MLPLFRKLRKRLLESGATGKYLLYAIGEILRVVFGILIALEVNNWNQQRQERAEEIEVLKSVQKDLAHIPFVQGLVEVRGGKHAPHAPYLAYIPRLQVPGRVFL